MFNAESQYIKVTVLSQIDTHTHYFSLFFFYFFVVVVKHEIIVHHTFCNCCWRREITAHTETMKTREQREKKLSEFINFHSSWEKIFRIVASIQWKALFLSLSYSSSVSVPWWFTLCHYLCIKRYRKRELLLWSRKKKKIEKTFTNKRNLCSTDIVD